MYKFLKKLEYLTEWTLIPSRCNRSIYENVLVKEFPSQELINGFIARNKGINYREHLKYKHISLFYKNEMESISAYNKLFSKEDIAYSTQFRIAKYRWGRVIPMNKLSLNIMHRPTRHSFCKDRYVDLDMRNCHPSIIQQVAFLNGVISEEMNKYIEDKNILLNKIQEHHDCTREIAKKLPITLCTGGNYRSWIIKNNISKNVNCDEWLYEVVKLQMEMSMIVDIVFISNQEIKIAIEKYNPKVFINSKCKYSGLTARRKVMGLWLQTIERIIQENAVLYLSLVYGIDISNIVPCQDGLMILKDFYNSNMLLELQYMGYINCGLSIVWEEKPFDEADLTIPSIYNFNDH